MKLTKFERDLKYGQEQELDFAKKYNLNIFEKRGGDFVIPDTDIKIELKSDRYDMLKTANFFIERYSNEAKKSNGGPWQALEHGCKYFVYKYTKNEAEFWFETNSLVAKLDEILSQYHPNSIKNFSWTTIGYKIPRETLKSLIIGDPNEELKKYNK